MPSPRVRRDARARPPASIGWSPVGPKTCGKCSRRNPPEHDVAVGHGRRAAAAIAGRAGIGAGGRGARPAGGRRRNAGSSRRPRRSCACRTSGVCRRTPSISAAKRRGTSPPRQAHVRRRAAHVEADQRRAGRRPCRRAIMPTTPPAGPDRTPFTPRKPSASTRPPLLCMNAQPRCAVRLFEARAEISRVAEQDRRQVRVRDGRIAAAM